MDTETARTLLSEEIAVVRARSLRLDAQLRDILDSSRWSTDDDEHDPEGSTIGFERAQIMSLIRDSTADLRELGDAQTRIEEGRYGLCERCARAIADPRLEALPAVRRCLACSELR